MSNAHGVVFDLKNKSPNQQITATIRVGLSILLLQLVIIANFQLLAKSKIGRDVETLIPFLSQFCGEPPCMRPLRTVVVAS